MYHKTHKKRVYLRVYRRSFRLAWTHAVICSQNIFPFLLYFYPSHTHLTDWPDFSVHLSSSTQHPCSRCRKLCLSGPKEFGLPPEDFMLWWKCVCWITAKGHRAKSQPWLRGWTHHRGPVGTDAALQQRQLRCFTITKCHLRESKMLWCPPNVWICWRIYFLPTWKNE